MDNIIIVSFDQEYELKKEQLYHSLVSHATN